MELREPIREVVSQRPRPRLPALKREASGGGCEGPDPCEGRLQLLDPWPGSRQTQDHPPSGSHEAPGDMPKGEAQPLRLRGGELAAQAEPLRPRRESWAS